MDTFKQSDPVRFAVRGFDPAREDTGWNLAAAKAIETAMWDFGETDRPYNSAVLAAGGGSLYPAEVKEGVYPLGADVRYRISPDGLKILEKRQMHKDIIEYRPASGSEKESAGYHTHVLSDVPEDSDVLVVLTRQPRVPEIVVTQHFMYTVGIDGKTAVEDRPPVK